MLVFIDFPLALISASTESCGCSSALSSATAEGVDSCRIDQIMATRNKRPGAESTKSAV